MNVYAITFFILYAIQFLTGLYNLSLGDKLTEPVPRRKCGTIQIVSVFIGVPLFLLAIGII